MDSALGWTALAGGLLLAAALLYAWWRNRQSSAGSRAHTERATHELYDDLSAEEHDRHRR